MSGAAPIDAVAAELYELGSQFAQKADGLADDPYFRDAVVKVAVSSFAWSMFHNFRGAADRWALNEELKTQSDAISRAVLAEEGSPVGDRWLSLQCIDHVQLAIPRGGENVARTFYAGLLGLTEQPKPTELAKRGGCWFEGGGVKVHLGIEAPFHPAKKAHIAFRVGDVAGLAAKARDAGFEVVEDDDLLPGHERVYILDPFGNRLEFLRPVG